MIMMVCNKLPFTWVLNSQKLKQPEFISILYQWQLGHTAVEIKQGTPSCKLFLLFKGPIITTCCHSILWNSHPWITLCHIQARSSSGLAQGLFGPVQKDQPLNVLVNVNIFFKSCFYFFHFLSFWNILIVLLKMNILVQFSFLLSPVYA